jgi:hypothetical protein
MISRRSFLRFLGLASVAGPAAIAASLKKAEGQTMVLELPPTYETDFSKVQIIPDFMIGKEPNVYQLPDIREDLADFLTILEPEDTPSLTLYSKPTTYIWQTSELK